MSVIPHKMMHNKVSINQGIFRLHGYGRTVTNPCAPFFYIRKFKFIYQFYHADAIYARTVPTEWSVGTVTVLQTLTVNRVFY